MAQVYYQSSDSEVTTATESESDSYDAEPETGSSANGSSDDDDGFENIPSVSNLIDLFARTSIRPLVEHLENKSGDASGVATPVPDKKSYVREDKVEVLIAKLLRKLMLQAEEEDELSAKERHLQAHKSRGKSYETLRFEKISQLLDSNPLICSDPREFGFKFLATCIACAFGGRKGYERYSQYKSQIKNMSSILPLMNGCVNHYDQLNVTRFCYVGHILIYYWTTNKQVRNALMMKFGDLNKVLISFENIKSEIGGLHLWTEKTHFIKRPIKRKILKGYESKLTCDEVLFAKVLEKLGIEI